MILRSYRRVPRLCAMLLACSAAGAVSASAQTPTPSVPTTEMAGSTRVHFGTWGVDLSTRDLSVKPGDDFQRYAAGKWRDATDIPADKSSNGQHHSSMLVRFADANVQCPRFEESIQRDGGNDELCKRRK